MWKTAMTAVEASQQSQDEEFCDNTDENLSNLTVWANDARRRKGPDFGVFAISEGTLFRGFDDEMPWQVFVHD